MMRTTSDTSGSDRISAYKRGSIRGMPGLGPGHFNQDGRASPTPSHATSIGEVSLCLCTAENNDQKLITRDPSFHHVRMSTSITLQAQLSALPII